MSRRKTHKEYVAEVEALGAGITVVGKYVNAITKITHCCAKGHEWDVKPNRILVGKGCPDCFRKRHDECLSKSHSEYVAQIDALNKGLTVVGEYIGNRSKITHRCAHGHEWDTKPSNVLGGSGCPYCAKNSTDANVFYLWQNADDPGVYKVGITSKRCANERIALCASRNGMTANIILMASVQDARDTERRALEIGDSVNYPDTIDGYTEFRRYSDEELGQVWRMAVAA
jgi:hypothetical protein